MAGIRQRGFTVIELMLFLGITGGLFAALMIGVNTNITQQRYRESVTTYASLLQRQFSEVLNTRNERDGTLKCADGVIDDSGAAGVDPRGASSCVILGRYLFVKDGIRIETGNVLGKDLGNLRPTNDIQAFELFNPKVSEYGKTTTSVDWQSTLTTVDGASSTASFLILRSPVSGLLRVFASEDAAPLGDLGSMITEASATTTVVNCVAGQSFGVPVQSVSVDPRIAGPDSVRIKDDSEC